MFRLLSSGGYSTPATRAPGALRGRRARGIHLCMRTSLERTHPASTNDESNLGLHAKPKAASTVGALLSRALTTVRRRLVGGPILTSAHPGNLELAEALGRCCAGPFRGGL